MVGEYSPFSVVIEEKILQILTFLKCVVLSHSLYMLLQLFSSHVCEYSATVQIDFRGKLLFILRSGNV